MFIIETEAFSLLSGKKIITPKEYAAITKVEDIIKRANAQAHDIIQTAQDTANNTVSEAKQQADTIIKDAQDIYNKEKARGYSEGTEKGKEEIAIQMMDLATKNVSSFTKLEEDIVGVVLRSIRRIIGEIDKTELITSVVKNALKIVKNQKHATLKVSTAELKIVRANIEKIKSDFPGIEFIDVFADINLKPGSCLLETEFGLVDASIDVQMEAIKKSLEKNLMKNNS